MAASVEFDRVSSQCDLHHRAQASHDAVGWRQLPANGLGFPGIQRHHRKVVTEASDPDSRTYHRALELGVSM